MNTSEPIHLCNYTFYNRPISVTNVGWYHTAEGIRLSNLYDWRGGSFNHLLLNFKKSLEEIGHPDLFTEYKNIEEAAYEKQLDTVKYNTNKRKKICHHFSKYHLPEIIFQ